MCVCKAGEAEEDRCMQVPDPWLRLLRLTAGAGPRPDSPAVALGCLSFSCSPSLLARLCVTREPSGLTHRWAWPLGAWRHEILFRPHRPVQLMESPGSTGYLPHRPVPPAPGPQPGRPHSGPAGPQGEAPLEVIPPPPAEQEGLA